MPARAARVPRRTSRARCGWSSAASTPGPAFGRERGEQRGLAAGTGAQVEPAPVAALHGRAGEREGDELGALVLDPGPSLAPRPEPRRGHRRPAPRRTATGWRPLPRRRPLLDARPARAAPRGRPAGARCRRPAGRRARRAHREPRAAPRPPSAGGSARPRRSRRVCIRSGATRRTQLVEVVLGDLAQHRVGEAGRPGPTSVADQVDGGGDGGVAGHPHREQLVGAEPQRVEHLRLDLGQLAVHARGQDGVVRALPADRAR